VSPHQSRLIRSSVVIALLLTALTAGCSASNSPTNASADSTPAATSTAKPVRVTVALDYIPNTNHIGLFAAKAEGFFADEGLSVRILPYGTTPAETLVAKGVASFGYSSSNGVAFARPAGLTIKQVFANISKAQYVLAYRANDKSITRPRDLDGKTYAGFGTPSENSEVSTVITADGGRGDFRTVVLDTAAYDAVYAGRADFTIAATTVEILEAQKIGKPLKYFTPEDFGYPQNYSNNVISSDSYLRAHGEVAKKFLRALQKGYRFAQDNPQRAADELVAANPTTLKDQDLVRRSAQALVEGDYLRNAQGQFGVIDGAQWTAFGNYLFDKKLLLDQGGKKLTARPDWSQYYTNEFVPTN
jgi:ABC-type nitrate/sulfonate/bicarbonate transport system substrate-binding protein